MGNRTTQQNKPILPHNKAELICTTNGIDASTKKYNNKWWYRYNLNNNSYEHIQSLPYYVNGIDGHFFNFTNHFGALRHFNTTVIIDIRTMQKISTLSGSYKHDYVVAINRDTVACTSRVGGTIDFYNYKTGACLSKYNPDHKNHTFHQYNTALHRYGDHGAVISDNEGRCEVYDMHQGKLFEVNNFLNSVMYTPYIDMCVLDESRLAGVFYIGYPRQYQIKIVNPSTGAELVVMAGHTDIINSIKKMDKNRIVSGSVDCSAKVWCTITGNNLRTFKFNSEVCSVVSLHGDLIAIATNVLGVWDVSCGAYVKELVSCAEKITNMSLLFDELPMWWNSSLRSTPFYDVKIILT
jgi:WD40 repeat protein